MTLLDFVLVAAGLCAGTFFGLLLAGILQRQPDPHYYPCPKCGHPVDVTPESPYNQCSACGQKSAVDDVNPF